MMKNLSYLLISTAVITAAACSPVVEEQKADSAGQLPQNLQPPVLLESEARLAEADAITSHELKKEKVGKLHVKPMKDQMFFTPMQAIGKAALPSSIRQASEPLDTEQYDYFDDNGLKLVKENPVSTFSIDVDTGSYSNARRMLNDGYLPRKDAIRVEEFINYFNYPESDVAHYGIQEDAPFAVYSEVGPSPWNQKTYLMRVSLKAEALPKSEMNGNNLVFLVDVSGSMRSPDKLGLLKKSLKMLSRQMNSNDKVSIVVYAGASGMALETVNGNDALKIEQALGKLEAGGSTNGAAGIKLAYQAARQAFIKGGNNRVILATDGDFNVGTVDHNALMDLIEQQRKQGVFLTTLGFGKGNYNDHLMEQLADKGNGNYAYIDNLMEAKKVLVDEIGSTLQTVAKDVKIQVEFNPQQVSEYRLIGYENRHLEREDFNNDKVDAGEIGAGHSVLALYEINMTSGDSQIDSLRYGKQSAEKVYQQPYSNELAFVKLRYKPVEQDQSILMTFPVNQNEVKNSLDKTSNNFRFASAVAAFGQKLRGGKYLANYQYQDIKRLAENSRGEDKQGLRSNFLQLVGLTEALDMKVSLK